MIKACIFDLDGTLLYTLESIARAGNAALSYLHLPLQPVEDYRYYCGDGADKLVERILKKTGDADPGHFQEACRINRRELERESLYHVTAYEGMPEALRALKREGISLGVCSNKPDSAVRDAITGIYGNDLFDAVQGQRPGIRLKPCPDAVLAVAEKLHAAPAECLYFGDTATDMQTGKAAGMETAGVLWGYRSRRELTENGAAHLLAGPGEIPALLKEVNS